MPPSSCEVLVIGAGPAGSAAAIWLARRGIDVVLCDRQPRGRDKTCGDGLTPRAVSELRRLDLDEWATDRIAIKGLRLRGFGSEHEISWPKGRFGQLGSAIPRRELDQVLAECAGSAGAQVHLGWGAEISRTCAMPGKNASSPTARILEVTLRGANQVRTIIPHYVVVADGASSTVGRALGREWHRELPHAIAARCYIRSGLHDSQWIGSDLELRDGDGIVQPGYGWVFPLGNGDINLGVGALSTSTRPAKVAVRQLLHSYVPTVWDRWQLDGEPRDVCSALLPMGGAVRGVAGSNWALTGDAAALINPLNGEGIDYGLEAGRLLAEVIAAKLATCGSPETRSIAEEWPALLREEFGPSFALARRLAALLTYRSFLPTAGPVGMASKKLMAATVRCMGNVTTTDDADLLASTWDGIGRIGRRADRILGRPLFS